jgi:uncharacterized lipoprotein YmbA
MRNIVHLVAVAALALAACATAGKSREVLSISGAPEVKAEDLAQCRALGPVHGEGVGGWGTTRDQQQYWARKDVANLAEKRGATHVEIVHELDDPNRLTVDGVAYRCGP